MYQREIASFARTILEDQPPVAGAEHGIAALRVALAALESVRTGEVVRLADGSPSPDGGTAAVRRGGRG